MKTVVIYESMYGNTHEVAERMAVGFANGGEAVCVPVGKATAEVLDGADLLVVGGPTHAHMISSATSRRGAIADAPKQHLTVDPDADGKGLRDWFHELDRPGGQNTLGTGTVRAAAFDTRLAASAVLTGKASKGIAKRLRDLGCRLVAEPESFLVDKTNHLLPGEADRAERWAMELVHSLTAASVR
jgi:hypothetical protein